MQCSSRDQRYYTTQQWGLGYGWNYQDAGISYALGYVFHRARIPTPAVKAQNLESNYWRQAQAGANPVGRWDTYGEEVISGNSQTFPNAVYRHVEQANVQFFDGHVSIMTKSEIYSSNSTTRKRLWWLRFK